MNQPLSEVTREIVLDVDIPEIAVGRLQGRRISMPAGVAAGAHTHNGPVVGSVERGRVLFQVAGEPSRVLGPGEVFHEPAHVVIEHFDALDEDLVFVAWFPVPAGVEPTLAPVLH